MKLQVEAYTRVVKCLSTGHTGVFYKFVCSKRGLLYQEAVNNGKYPSFADLVVTYAKSDNTDRMVDMLKKMDNVAISTERIDNMVTKEETAKLKALISAGFLSIEATVVSSIENSELAVLKFLVSEFAYSLHDKCGYMCSGFSRMLHHLSMSVILDNACITVYLLEQGVQFDEQCFNEIIYNYNEIHFKRNFHPKNVSFEKVLLSNPSVLTQESFLQLCNCMPFGYVQIAIPIAKESLDINYMDKHGRTAFSIIMKNSMHTASTFLDYFKNSDIDAQQSLRAVLDYDKKVEWHRRYGNCFVHTIPETEIPARQRLISKLLQYNVNPNEYDQSGKSLLFYARSPCDIQLLLEHGFDQNHCDNDGNSARSAVLNTLEERCDRCYNAISSMSYSERFELDETELKREILEVCRAFDAVRPKKLSNHETHKAYRQMLLAFHTSKCIHPADLVSVLSVCAETNIDRQMHRQWWSELNETTESWNSYIDRGTNCTEMHTQLLDCQENSHQNDADQLASKRLKTEPTASDEQIARDLQIIFDRDFAMQNDMQQ